MTTDRWRALAFGVAVHLGRFGVILLALAVAPLVGISGWFLGLAANVACVAYAAILVTVRRQWRTSGIFALWRGPVALLLLLPLVAEILLWVVPGGLAEQAPGFGLWSLTLLLVGVNEELTSRVIVLERMRASFAAVPAVAITAALFGLQHLSAFATTSRAVDDVLWNVLVSGCYGAALAAFQFRFRWLLPLVLLHATADFVSILTVEPLPDPVIGFTCVLFLVLAALILAGVPRELRSSPTHARGDIHASVA